MLDRSYVAAPPPLARASHSGSVGMTGDEITMPTLDRSGGVHLDECLLDRYLEILNRAVADTRGRFPFNVVLTALQEELAGRAVIVELHDEHDERTALIICRFDGTRLVRGADSASPATCWTVALEHVHDVVGRPWRYLADPMRLELPPFSLCSPSITNACRPTRRPDLDRRTSCMSEGAPR
jgi:hypothetical protein